MAGAPDEADEEEVDAVEEAEDLRALMSEPLAEADEADLVEVGILGGLVLVRLGVGRDGEMGRW